jgi:hypothetical protein
MRRALPMTARIDQASVTNCRQILDIFVDLAANCGP